MANDHEKRRPSEGRRIIQLGGGDCDNDNANAFEVQGAFATPAIAALALLNSGQKLTRKAGSFLGQCAVDDTPLTAKQFDWLATLLDRAGLPHLDGEA